MLRVHPFCSALLICGLLLMLVARDTFAAQSHRPRHRTPPPAVHTVEQERDVAEALFRYLLPKARDDWKGVKVVFLSCNGKDPDAPLLLRFANNPLPVKAESASGNGQKLKVVDRATGQEGVVLSVGRIKWISNTNVEVKGGYYHDGKGAMGTTFRMVRQGSRWSVKQTGKVYRA